MPKTISQQSHVMSPAKKRSHLKCLGTPKDNMDIIAFRRIARKMGISPQLKRNIQKYRRKQRLDLPNDVVVNRRIADSFVKSEESVTQEKSDTK